MTDYESVLCVKNEVFVYKIPARTSNRGYRAADWKLDEPDWKGRLRIASKGADLYIKLEDRNTGELFAKCPVDGYPGVAVEQVLDSSRYFVLRLQDDGGRAAFVGLGFADRGDSFDLIVAIQDHFKWMKREAAEKEDDSSAASQASNQPAAPKVDLGFKQGQTIKLNLSTKKKEDKDDDDEPSAAASKSRPIPRMQGNSSGILPPPPGSAGRIAPPPSGRAATQAPAPRAGASPQHQMHAAPTSPQQQQWRASPPATQPPAPQVRPQQGNIVDLLGDLDLSAGSAPLKAASSGPHTVDLLGGFLDTSASQPAAPQASAGWTNFN